MKNIQYGTEFLDQLKDKVHEQQWEIERLNEKENNQKLIIERRKKEMRILNNRINKAIEYIENNEWYTKLRKTFINDLLDILKGVDKE